MTSLTIRELLCIASACQDCERVHECRQLTEHTWTWAAPDGHDYRPHCEISALETLWQIVQDYENRPLNGTLFRNNKR